MQKWTEPRVSCCPDLWASTGRTGINTDRLHKCCGLVVGIFKFLPCICSNET